MLHVKAYINNVKIDELTYSYMGFPDPDAATAIWRNLVLTGRKKYQEVTRYEAYSSLYFINTLKII